MFATDGLWCKINGTAVGCRRVRGDLVYIGNGLVHGVGYVNTLKINTLNFFYGEKYDTEEVHFGMFVASAGATSVTIGSH